MPDNRYVLRHATSVTFQFLDAATSQHIVLAYHCVECSTVIEQQTGSGAAPIPLPMDRTALRQPTVIQHHARP